MKKSFLLLPLCTMLLMSACLWKHSQQEQPLPVDAEEIAQETTENVLVSAEEKPVMTTNQPVSTAKTTASSNAPQSMRASVTTEEEIVPAAPVESVGTPLQETAQFKDEELISLSGRHLNPFVNAPASTVPQTAPWKNEQLKYGVYYSFVKAGTAYIKNRGLVDIDGRPAYLIQTSAFSAAVIDAVFKVRDINYSWIDAEDFYSRGYSQSLREGNYKRDEWVIFDYATRSYRGEVKKKDEPRAFEGTLTQQVLDILSALYYVRTRTLEPGQEIIFDIINREEQYPLVVKVLKRETVKTAAGKFKCIVVEPQFRGEGIFVSKGKSLQVWLTDDKYKMPVKMKTEVFIGSVSAELLDYKRN